MAADFSSKEAFEHFPKRGTGFVGFLVCLPQRFASWWLHLTSSEGPAITWKEREREQRSRLASWIILAVLLATLVGTFSAIGDMHALSGVGIIALGTIVATILNRTGRLMACATTLVVLLTSVFLYVVTPELQTPGGGLDVDSLSQFDLLAIPLVIGIYLFKTRWGLVITVINIILMTLDFTLQAKTPYLEAEMQRIFGGDLLGTLGCLSRPAALQVMIAGVAYLGALGFQRASLEAARAREEVEIQERYVALQAQNLEALDLFARQVTEAVKQAEQGDFQLELPPGHPFAEAAWRINHQLHLLYPKP